MLMRLFCYLLILIALTNGFLYTSADATILKAPTRKYDVRTLEKEIFKMNSINDLRKLGLNVPDTVTQVDGLTVGKIQGRKSSFLSIVDQKDPNIKEATPGRCDPKPVCITNPLTETLSGSNQIVFPPCINIHECGGCCPQNEICKPVSFDNLKLTKVGVINIMENGQMNFVEKIVEVKNHTGCECQCQWQTDDDCKAVNPGYVKDEHACGCVCPKELQCSAYHEFDKTTCKCVCNREKYGKIETTCKNRNMKWNDNICRCEALKPTPKETK